MPILLPKYNVFQASLDSSDLDIEDMSGLAEVKEEEKEEEEENLPQIEEQPQVSVHYYKSHMFWGATSVPEVFTVFQNAHLFFHIMRLFQKQQAKERPQPAEEQEEVPWRPVETAICGKHSVSTLSHCQFRKPSPSSLTSHCCISFMSVSALLVGGGGRAGGGGGR